MDTVTPSMPISKILQVTFLLIAMAFLCVGTTFAASHDFHLSASTGSESGTVHLSWTDRDYVENYNIMYGDAPGSYQHGVIGTGDGESYTIGGLTPGKTYYFTLIPVDDGHAGEQSAEVSAVAAGVSTVKSKSHDASGRATSQAASSVSASAPSDNDDNLRATAGIQTGTVSLHWKPVDYAENYHVVYGPSAGNYTWGVLNVGREGTYTIGGLESGKTYYFAIIRVDDDHAQEVRSHTSSVAR